MPSNTSYYQVLICYVKINFLSIIFPIPYFVGQGNLPLYHNQTIRHKNLIAYLILRRSKQVIWNEAVKIILLTSSSSSRRMKSGFNQRSLDHHVIYLLPICTLCVYIQLLTYSGCTDEQNKYCLIIFELRFFIFDNIRFIIIWHVDLKITI